jgi:hypothetical protein
MKVFSCHDDPCSAGPHGPDDGFFVGWLHSIRQSPADDVNRAASDRNDLGAAPVCSNVHTIAKSGHKTIEMVDNTVVKIIPKDGKRFSSNVHAYREGNDLVLCYADGTAVTISNL